MVGKNQNSINNNVINPYSFKDVFVKIKEWSSFLKKKLKWIFFISFLGGCLGLVYSYIQKPIYKATLSFVIEGDASDNKISDGLSNLLENSSLETQGGGGLFSNSSLFQLMKSRLIIEKVLLNPVIIVQNGKKEIISFAEYYIRINGLRNTWKDDTALSKIQFNPNSNRSTYTIKQDSTLYHIYKNIISNYLLINSRDKKSNINVIEVSSNNEFFSKLFCDAIAKEISTFYLQTKNLKARNDVDILQKEIDSITSELSRLIEDVGLANDNIYNLNPTLNVKKSYSNIRQVKIETSKSLLIQLRNQLELSKINLRNETPLIQVLDYPTFPLEKTTISKRSSFFITSLLAGVISIIFFLFSYLFNK